MGAEHRQIMATLKDVEVTLPRPGGLWRRQQLNILRGIDLEIFAGESLGLVGESGGGKSTLARLLVCLVTASVGRVQVVGQDLAQVRSPSQRRSLFRQVQMVFQDPRGCLDPRWRGRAILKEMRRLHDLPDDDGVLRDLLAEVGLPDETLDRFPHQLSGGQRQRLALARALAVEPSLLIADEPVSALDLSTQARILTLLATLQRQRGLTLVLISHDLEAVAACCDRVAVMYLGRLVEILPAKQLHKARHPYTRALLASVPTADPSRRRPPDRLPSEAASLTAPPTGCPFHPRCDSADAHCSDTMPSNSAPQRQDFLACHHPYSSTETPPTE